MAVTIAVTDSNDQTNGARRICGTITFDASYPTGGEVCDFSSYLAELLDGNLQLGCKGSGYVPQHDGGSVSAGKVLLYEAGADAAALDEVANTTDVSNIVAWFNAVGKPT